MTTTTSRLARLDQIKKKVDEFEKLQRRFADFGADDTEPDWQWQNCLRNAINGKDKVPNSPDKWELCWDENDGDYDAPSDRVLSAASILSDKAQETVNLILEAQVKEIGEIINYIQGHCDRLDF